MEKLKFHETKFGLGVQSISSIRAGEEIVEFTGKRFRYEELPVPYSDVDDHYMQIGPRLYMGPSEGFDNYVNHSCEPNAGLKFIGEKIILVAVRDIDPGEEISFDYSTTMAEDEWEMDCMCGAKNCRGRIQDFRKLPLEIREKYISLGIVPEFVLVQR